MQSLNIHLCCWNCLYTCKYIQRGSTPVYALTGTRTTSCFWCGFDISRDVRHASCWNLELSLHRHRYRNNYSYSTFQCTSPCCKENKMSLKSTCKCTMRRSTMYHDIIAMTSKAQGFANYLHVRIFFHERWRGRAQCVSIGEQHLADQTATCDTRQTGNTCNKCSSLWRHAAYRF